MKNKLLVCIVLSYVFATEYRSLFIINKICNMGSLSSCAVEQIYLLPLSRKLFDRATSVLHFLPNRTASLKLPVGVLRLLSLCLFSVMWVFSVISLKKGKSDNSLFVWFVQLFKGSHLNLTSEISHIAKIPNCSSIHFEDYGWNKIMCTVSNRLSLEITLEISQITSIRHMDEIE